MSKPMAEIKEELKHAYEVYEESRGNSDLFNETLVSYLSDRRIGVRKIIERYSKKQLKFQQELVRARGMYAYEHKYENCTYICGIDEAGRGPLAGPVAAGAVILPKDLVIPWLNDSKQVSPTKREELYSQICQQAVAYGVGLVSPERIDEINILQATYEAMRQAISKLTVKPDVLLNDAVVIPGVDISQESIIRGDAKSASIAAASILAKVTRDRLMVEYEREYPGYGFVKNKGYGSKEHIQALQKLGPTPIHRRTFIGHFVGEGAGE